MKRRIAQKKIALEGRRRPLLSYQNGQKVKRIHQRKMGKKVGDKQVPEKVSRGPCLKTILRKPACPQEELADPAKQKAGSGGNCLGKARIKPTGKRTRTQGKKKEQSVWLALGKNPKTLPKSSHYLQEKLKHQKKRKGKGDLTGKEAEMKPSEGGKKKRGCWKRSRSLP